MPNPKLITNQIIREYDFVGNAWEHVDIFFRMHASCLHSGFLECISPVELHTLISLSLFMQENGRIEVSISEFARAIGISIEQAERRIASLTEFEFRGLKVVHIEESKSEPFSANDPRLVVHVVPLTSGDVTDQLAEQHDPLFFNHDQSEATELLAEPLLAFLFERVGADRLTDADIQFVGDLQFHPFELPPAVIEVLVDYVMTTRGRLDRHHAETLAYSWSTNCIHTREQALTWIEETDAARIGTGAWAESAASFEGRTDGYLLEYLRDRLKREPSAVQREMIHSLLKPPYAFEAGVVEVLIDYVVSQMVIRNGKPDFPKPYVQAIVNDWFEKTIATREEALKELAKWRENFVLSPPAVNTEQSLGEQGLKKSASPSKKKLVDSGASTYINRLKKAGL